MERSDAGHSIRMARYTSAYTDLLGGLQEVSLLHRPAASLEQADPLGNSGKVRALCRGSIVLLVAHIEAYIENLGELVLERLFTRKIDRAQLPSQAFYHLTHGTFKKLRETSDPEKSADVMFEFIANEASMWSRSGPFPNQPGTREFNWSFANPKFDKVRSYLRRFGYTTYETDLARALRSNHSVVVNAMNHIVDIRHEIAHGVYATTKTPAEVAEMNANVRLFCRTTDLVFATWCRKHLCSIW